ncbi:hypothetical protein PMKS-000687 [Pichia membranifaciens]|uniref:Uncharacterized protein n=1 Tax=Pichia membranifaciens TaxID=4926 RepID=A0A1Q2YCU9_9ASCO|nr:hypothetical protein PMKS-000687 [Pichia membranifaciens]
MLLTSFNEILYLDSDNIPVSSVADMFNDPNYLKTGFVSWADFWKRSTNYNFYSMAGLTGVTGDTSYLITGHKTKSFGYKNKQGAYVGQGILQTDPSNFSKYWFLHINYPKLDLVSMFKKGFFKGDKLERKWTFIRNAQEDGKSVPFRQTLGKDLEYEVWKIMTSILDTDFKGFRLFEEIGNDEMSDYVKAHLVRLEHSKLETR